MIKKLFFLLVLLSLVAIFCAAFLYQKIFQPNVHLNKDEVTLYVPSQTDYSSLLGLLSNEKIIEDTSSFKLVSQLMKFDQPKAGRYLVKNAWSNKQLISVLRSGRQNPLKLTFNNQRTIYELIGSFAAVLESDSLELKDCLLDSAFLKKEGFSEQTILTLFLPNTYELYWNCNCDCLRKRFKAEYQKFYNNERETLLKSLDLTKAELYTLASIVQKETLVADEKPVVAGVYLNRLKRGQLLQADPTVVYASGQFDLRRVLNRHLAIDSPYNTYKYAGLPPGPICMPDISSIDAVLNYERHKYLYFCASPDNSGRHVFAKTLSQHNVNANKYRRFLNKKGIYR